MKIFKCAIYAVIIAVLIIILVKSIGMLREDFESESTSETGQGSTTSSTVSSIINSASDVIENIKNSEVVNSAIDTASTTIDNVKNSETINNIVDSVKNTINNSNKEEVDIVKENEILPNEEDITTQQIGESTPEIITTLEGGQEDILTKPKYVDETTKTVMDGVKFNKQSVLSPWASGYMGNNADSGFMINLGGDDLDQGSGRFSRRSPACCSPQYPLPFKLKVDDAVCLNKDEYVPNPYMGNDNWTNAGCMCMKKSNMEKLATRGGNA